MAETPSAMLPLGTPLPPLKLPDTVSGKLIDAAALAEGKKGLLVYFIGNHCPYVKHILSELVKASHEALDQGFAVVAVCANDAKEYPQDGPAAMGKLAREQGWRFPYVFDESQDVARAFHAECTPDLFLFDGRRRLAYRGQFDDSRPSLPRPVDGASLRAALSALAAGKAPGPDQKASVGCNIKWKPGRAPGRA
jgi:peroxiredoxin